MAEHFDLLIRGGTLVDGTGAPARPGDVAIRDGRIAALGAVPGAARRVLDAEGAVVAPGFVDIHTHYDAQVFWDRMLTISPWHGVTS
ncbi:MAG: amidohydrolase, partial [Deltaproteobacteria bacterium]